VSFIFCQEISLPDPFIYSNDASSAFNNSSFTKSNIIFSSSSASNLFSDNVPLRTLWSIECLLSALKAPSKLSTKLSCPASLSSTASDAKATPVVLFDLLEGEKPLSIDKRFLIASSEIDLDCNARLGKGKFGVVFKGVLKSNGQSVAVKRFHKQMDEQVLMEEAIVLGQLNHENIVKLYGISPETKNQFIVMELVEGGKTLQFYLDKEVHRYSTFPFETKLSIAIGISRAMEYLHTPRPWFASDSTAKSTILQFSMSASHMKENDDIDLSSNEEFPIIHRDLKPENVLIDVNTFQAKLCDFGFAFAFRPFGISAGIMAGTSAYMAPEMWAFYKSSSEWKERQHYNEKVDVWSFGVMLWFIFSGKDPFHASFWKNFEKGNVIPQEQEETCKPPIPSTWGNDPKLSRIKSIVESCCELKAANRIPFKEIVKRLTIQEENNTEESKSSSSNG